MLLELHKTPKWYNLHVMSTRTGSFTSYCSRKDPTYICRPDSRTREISGNQAWKQKLTESVSFIIISSSAPWRIIWQLKMVTFRHQHPKWDKNPWFVPEMTNIRPTFSCRSPPGFQPSVVYGRFTAACSVSSYLLFSTGRRYNDFFIVWRILSSSSVIRLKECIRSLFFPHIFRDISANIIDV